MKLRQILGARKPLTDFLDRFVAKQLPAILDEIGRPPVRAIDSFGPGRNTLVRRLTLADGGALVLRAFPVDPDARPGFSHWHLNRHLAGRGLRVPAIHLRRTFPFRRGRSDVEILLEEFIDGRPIVGDVREDDAARRRLAETLRVIHGESSDRPGRPWLGQTTADPLDLALEQAPVRFSRVRSQLPDIPPGKIDRCLEWLRDAIARRPKPPSYEFIHGDYGRDNLLLTPDGEIALIDLGNMAYGCFEIDLVDANWSFFDQAWWEKFCDDYFADAPEWRERFERTAPVFFVIYYLRKAASRAVRARKAAESGDAAAAESLRAECRRFWEMLEAAMEGFPSAY